MSVGPLGGLVGSLAGSPLAQTKGSEIERAQHDASAQQRQAVSDRKAESASGIGETDGQDHETSDRDADGRRLWERPPAKNALEAGDPAELEQKLSKDVTGQAGNTLDLSG